MNKINECMVDVGCMDRCINTWIDTCVYELMDREIEG